MIGFLKTGISTLPTVRLEAARLYLRPPRGRDWRAWATLREESHAFLAPWEPAWPADALSRAAFMRRLRRQAAEWRRDEGYNFLIFHRSGDSLLGGIGLSNVRRGVAQMASLGYWIGQRHAGHGYMGEAARAVVEFGFRQVGLHRIEAFCLPHNEPSRRLLEGLGFRQEGLAREYLRINGVWQDHLLHALLRSDAARR